MSKLSHVMRKNKVLVAFVSVFAALWLVPHAFAAGPTAAERALLVEMNKVRAQHGAPALRYDLTLRRAAAAHSADMLRRGYFAHGSIGRRLQSFGARGPYVGENLAWGVGSGASARIVVRRWLASPSHRANLLRHGFRRVGLGFARGTFRGHRGATVVTADFAGR